MKPKDIVLLKPTFIVQTDVFSTLSAWERAQADFYKQHNVEMKKVSMLGTGESEPIYMISNIDKLDKMRKGEK